MVLSLVVDDTSLLLLLVLVAALATSVYVSRSYQPLIHPLILTRQADVSQTRQPKESAIYRNANSPSGFDLALRPRKEVNDIADLIKYGANGSERHSHRSIYGKAKSNDDVAGDATAFATGFIKLSSAPVNHTVLAVVSEVDSYEALIALLANTHTSVSSRFHAAVLSPEQLHKHTPSSLPTTLSNNGAPSVIGVFTTANSIDAVLALPLIDPSALIIVPAADFDHVKMRVNDYFGGSHRLRIYDFTAVVQAGSRGSLLTNEAVNRQVIDRVQSFYWNAASSQWIAVQHANLIAGVTSQLASFPADKIPTTADHLFVEGSSAIDAPASSLMATRTPFGFALALTALYTGSAITSDLATASYDDPNPAPSTALVHAKPTLVYASAEGASSLACALATCSRRSPLVSWATKNKLFTLRNGTFSRNGLADRLVFALPRQITGTVNVRNVFIAGRGDTVPQALLDSLRSHLGCSVLNAYLPKLKGAAATAAVSATHVFDLQAFADHETGAMQVPAHVGPPSVSAEIKLVQSQIALDAGFTITGDRQPGHLGDPMGEILVRGNILARSTSSEDDDGWSPTGDLGAIRSNGTLVVLRDADEADVAGVPTLSARKPVVRQRRHRSLGSSTAKTVVTAALLMATAITPASAATWMKRGSSINNTMSDMAKMGMLVGQRASWEQGASQAALLELDYPGWSVFSSVGGGPPFKPGKERKASGPPNEVIAMAYASASRSDNLGRMAFRITGDEQTGSGSSLDGAAPGTEVLLAAWLDGEIDRNTGAMGSGFYTDAVRNTLDMVLRRTPRARSGAISHRYSTVALWSDAIYMMPPFLSFYGMITRNNTLLQTAYDQIRLHRDVMRLTTGASTNLWGHILIPDNRTWTDGGAWATGNGWVLAGMARTLATIEQSQASSQMTQQKTDLVNWMQEILDASWPLLDERALLFHNYMNDTRTFYDSAGTALIAYATYRLASMSPSNNKWISQADVVYRSLATSLNEIGQFREGYPVVDVLAFVHQGETSSESLAFMMLMNAAKRDYQNNNVVRITAPGIATNAAASSTSTAPGAVLVAIAFACLLFTLL
ncbi:uncharacterized protein UMAG_02207 [Mycosarcoma maydis]|uniref:Uncharacterized protein n=1 Tax=Mycosarcoma maydis TaxID=5270 RepID=A0A0D1E187_MYCMD|nr:uncharacterized protein UMAG_02207 [Ustilago maydis 521]KIS69676.1 hypothetical protein UMAG_02207 [Ustilago maydis 521]|eukprot:XP_011388550.1 hypothetical protein UMAG_02207 [Ustilago maydis 521]